MVFAIFSANMQRYRSALANAIIYLFLEPVIRVMLLFNADQLVHNVKYIVS
jgi:hypothetical protein